VYHRVKAAHSQPIQKVSASIVFSRRSFPNFTQPFGTGSSLENLSPDSPLSRSRNRQALRKKRLLALRRSRRQLLNIGKESGLNAKPYSAANTRKIFARNKLAAASPSDYDHDGCWIFSW